MNRYMLSSGRTTTKIQEYILDLFSLYLGLNPGDVPGLPDFGFNFTFAGVPKMELMSKMEFRINAFLEKIGKSFPNHRIVLEELIMPTEETVKIVVSVDGSTATEPIYLNIYEDR